VIAKAPSFAFSLVEIGYVGSLQSLGALLDSKLDALAFYERAESIGLDGAVMDKDVFATITGNEAVALRVTEPLDSSNYTVTHGRYFLLKYRFVSLAGIRC
jgi:hypothetical protein